jgi:hypothetical protein
MESIKDIDKQSQPSALTRIATDAIKSGQSFFNHNKACGERSERKGEIGKLPSRWI